MKSRGRMIVVFGPPGGVGKTTLAVNLALAIAQDGTGMVGLIDFDFRFPDVAVALHLPLERNFAGLAGNEKQLTVAEVRQFLYKHSTGLYVLPSIEHPEQRKMLDTLHAERSLSSLRQAYDYLVIDTGGVLNEAVNHALKAANQVLVIQPTDLETLKDGELAIERVASCGVPEENISLVLNAVHEISYLQPDAVREGLGLPVLCSIPYDPAVSASENGTPIILSTPESEVSKAIRSLAGSLT